MFPGVNRIGRLIGGRSVKKGRGRDKESGWRRSIRGLSREATEGSVVRTFGTQRRQRWFREGEEREGWSVEGEGRIWCWRRKRR